MTTSIASPPPDLPALLTLEEAADCLRIEPGELRRLATARRIAHYRVGAKLRFSADQIRAYLDAIRVDPDQGANATGRRTVLVAAEPVVSRPVAAAPFPAPSAAAAGGPGRGRRVLGIAAPGPADARSEKPTRKRPTQTVPTQTNRTSA